MSTHYMDEADKLCDEIAIINKGHIIKSDSPKNLKQELKADIITMKVDDQEKFIKEAKKLDFIRNVMVVGSEVKLMVESGENLIATLVDFSNKNNIMVKSIELDHPNLEDVFINYTGKRIVEGA